MSRLEREKMTRLLGVIVDTRTWMLSHVEVRCAPNAGFIHERLTAALEDHGWLKDPCGKED